VIEKTRPGDLSRFIRRARQEANYNSIRDLWSAIQQTEKSRGKKWISYTYFQQIESLGKVPEIEVFLTIVNFLELDQLKACFLYAKSIMPTEQTKNYFDLSAPTTEELSSALLQVPKTARMEADQVYEMSISEIEYFASHEDSYEVILALADTIIHDADGISKITRIPKTKVKKALSELVQMGLVTKTKDQYSFVRSAFRLSGNQATKDLQWRVVAPNLKRTHLRFYDSASTSPKYRMSGNLPLRRKDAEVLLSKLREVSKTADAVERDPAEDTELFHLSIYFSPRFYEGGKEVRNA
jgi:DNA-binding MarR family transcriptional regulator